VSSPDVVKVSLFAPLGGRWHTALNTDVFIAVWSEVCHQGDHRNHDWVVKVDPDSVFFPVRLRWLLQKHDATRKVMAIARRLSSRRGGPRGGRPRSGGVFRARALGQSDDVGGNCGQCAMKEFLGVPCEDHVHFLQQGGASCEDALKEVNSPAPGGCGCACSSYEACSLVNGAPQDLVQEGQVVGGKEGDTAVYINNCRFGLHGPVEVLSSKAVDLYLEGVKTGHCAQLRRYPWGEDKFMDRCMLQMGITRVNLFDILSEIACGKTPAPCDGPNVVFHPFKSVESYMACWTYATLGGHHNVSKHV
jgi:hypothetical protein